MLQALNSLGHDQFEYARWCPETSDSYKIIKVSIVSENAKRWDTVIANLITQSNSTVLLTSYAYPYKERQHIFYRDKWWEITAIGEKNLDVNPQSLALVNSVINKQCVLEIQETDWL